MKYFRDLAYTVLVMVTYIFVDSMLCIHFEADHSSIQKYLGFPSPSLIEMYVRQG